MAEDSQSTSLPRGLGVWPESTNRLSWNCNSRLITMFTGIIEHLGTISRLEVSSAGGKITVHAPSLAPKLAISASIAVNGCCLTVVHRDDKHFSAYLSRETLAK